MIGILARKGQESGSRLDSLRRQGVQRLVPEMHQFGQPGTLGVSCDRLVVDHHRIGRLLQLHQGTAQPGRRLGPLDRLRIGRHRSQHLLGFRVLLDAEPALARGHPRFGNKRALGELLGKRFEHRRRFGQFLLLPHRMSLLQQGQVGLGKVGNRSGPGKQRLRLGILFLPEQAQPQSQRDLCRVGVLGVCLEEPLVGHRRFGVLLELLLGRPQSVQDVRFETRWRLQGQRAAIGSNGRLKLLSREQAFGLEKPSLDRKGTLRKSLGHPPVLDSSRLEVRRLTRGPGEPLGRQSQVELDPVGQLVLGMQLQQLLQRRNRLGILLELQLADGEIQPHRRHPDTLGMSCQERLPMRHGIGVETFLLKPLRHDVVTGSRLLGIGLLGQPTRRQQQYRQQPANQFRGHQPAFSSASHTHIPSCQCAVTSQHEFFNEATTHHSRLIRRVGSIIPSP